MLIVYKKYQGLKTIWIHANIIFTSFNKLYEKLSFVEFLKVKIYNKQQFLKIKIQVYKNITENQYHSDFVKKILKIIIAINF